MAIEISIISGARCGERLTFDAEQFRAGVDPACEVYFDSRVDPSVRDRIASFRLQTDGWYVQQIGGGPILLNHDVVQRPTRLRSGDVVRMSEQGPDFSFSIVAQAGTGPPATVRVRAPAATSGLSLESVPPVQPAPLDPAPLPLAHHAAAPLPQATPGSVEAVAQPNIASRAAAVPAGMGGRAPLLLYTLAGVAICAFCFIMAWIILVHSDTREVFFGEKRADPPPPPAAVTEISPSQGPTAGGTSVMISGTNLANATAVKFGTAAATSFTVNSATQIVAMSPPGTGVVDVTVTTAGGTSAALSADQFSYASVADDKKPQLPVVTGISPSQGPAAGGTPATITGANLTNATAVKFGTVAATSFTVSSATQIVATSPPGTGVVDVTVTTAGGTSATLPADQFSYAAGPPPPDWPKVTAGLKGAVLLIQLEMATPAGASTWPFATCCAVRDDTVLTSAAVASDLVKKFPEKKFKIWVADPNSGTRHEVREIRIASGYQQTAGRPDEQRYFDLALLVVVGKLAKTAPLASAKELADLEKGMPLACFGFSPKPAEITRFDHYEPQPAVTRILLVKSPPPHAADGPRTLDLTATLPEYLDGSPLLSAEGKVVAVYGKPAEPEEAKGLKDLHFAAVAAAQLIEAWLHDHDARAWTTLTPPESPPKAKQ